MDDLIEVTLGKEEQVAVLGMIEGEFSNMRDSRTYDAVLHRALIKLKDSIIHGTI